MRELEINGKTYEMSIGFRVFTLWMKRSNATNKGMMSGEYKPDPFDLFELAAMGINDAHKKANRKSRITAEQLLNLCDDDGAAFTRTLEEVGDAIGIITDKIEEGKKPKKKAKS